MTLGAKGKKSVDHKITCIRKYRYISFIETSSKAPPRTGGAGRRGRPPFRKTEMGERPHPLPLSQRRGERGRQGGDVRRNRGALK